MICQTGVLFWGSPGISFLRGRLLPPLRVFAVSRCITMKFCTGVDHQSVTSNIERDFQKFNHVIDNDLMMMIPLSLCQKCKKAQNICVLLLLINGHIIVKFCTGVAHEKPISHTKQNSEIYTDVIDNDLIMLKFKHFR